ncbi:MAG: histidine phosphatase family protein [Pseudomonadota bacterium]
MARALYLNHPQVIQDPAIPVPDWPLNKIGRARVGALAASDALADVSHVFSSTEQKARDTATPLAQALGLVPVFDPEMGENDRSATGYLHGVAFEAHADAFFAAPDVSVRGWETARDAQMRIVNAVDRALRTTHGDVLFVGHGAVGTLLWCALSGVDISREHDQGPGGGGNWFAFDLDKRQPLSAWRPMEELAKDVP